MDPNFLKKLLKRPEVVSLLPAVASVLVDPVRVRALDGSILWGNGEVKAPFRFPVNYQKELVAWVEGGQQASIMASLLSYMLAKEIEKRAVAREVLDTYKELSILYRVSEEVHSLFDIREIARLIINEAKKFLHFTSASIMLLNEDIGELEIVWAYGQQQYPKVRLSPGLGIAGNIFTSGTAEIINQVWNDTRFVPGGEVHSLICCPLKSKDRVFGVMNLSTRQIHNYTSRDLKMAILLSSQAAWAIENVILHEDIVKQERLRSQLERYVAPQIIDLMSETSEAKDASLLVSQRQNISILFSDIRNFSSICEQLRPEEIVSYLNEYFAYMVEIVFEKGGTLNKFVGDMMVAIFGAPFELSCHEKRAVEAAILMQQTLRHIPNNWIQQNFATGIGISSGDVVVGNIGSPKHMDYTAIGDEVNVAERLQSIAEGGQILVTKSIFDVTKRVFNFREYGDIRVKGKEEKVKVFEVLY